MRSGAERVWPGHRAGRRVVPSGPGYLTVYPCAAGLPLASNLNFAAGQTVANSATVPVGTDGRICVMTTVATHLVVDFDELYVTVP